MNNKFNTTKKFLFGLTMVYGTTNVQAYCPQTSDYTANLTCIEAEEKAEAMQWELREQQRQLEVEIERQRYQLEQQQFDMDEEKRKNEFNNRYRNGNDY